jgi:outer membrane protein assembly factor BamB
MRDTATGVHWNALSYYTGVFTRPTTQPFTTPPAHHAGRLRLTWSRAAVLTAALACGLPAIAASQPPPQGARPPSTPRKADQAVSTDAPAPSFPGGILWQVVLPAAPAHAPAFDDTSAYVDLRDGTLTALVLETGRQAWLVSQASSVPTSAGNGLVAGVHERVMWAREASSGALRWQRTLAADAITAVTLSGDAIVVGTGDDQIVCVSQRDGAPRWQRPLGVRPTAAPLATASLVVVGMKNGHVTALDPATGTVRWDRPLVGTIIGLSTWDDRVAAGSDDNFLYVLDAATGELKWRWRTGGDVVGAITSDAHYIYYVSMDNTLRAHNRENGHLRWQRTLSSRPVGSPVPVGDRLIVASVSPELRGFKIKDGTAAGVVTLPGRGIHSPRVAAGSEEVPAHIVVVSGGGHVQAIGQTIEPAVVPLENLPGVRLTSEAPRR